MILSFFIITFLIISLYGYSVFLKSALTTNEKVINIYNIDILYGLFFLILTLLIIHFFIPTKYILFLFITTGSCLFLIFRSKKYYKNLNLLEPLFLIFLVIFINSSNSPVYDTQLYHHQILNWNFNYKMVMNPGLVDDRMMMTSPWQLFLSIGNFKIFDVFVAIILNFLPFYIIFAELIGFLKKKSEFERFEIFLLISVLYIFFFSLIHPFQNGIILMHLGSLGTDFAAMIFLILTIYFFLKYIFIKSNDCFRYIVILSSLTVFCRISYIPILLLPTILIFNKKLFIKELNFNFLVIFTFIVWFLRSLLNNGCFIYPAEFTCLNFDNYISKEVIQTYSNIVKSFARTAPDHTKFMDINYSINTYQWFFPWFKKYFLINSLTQIFLAVILILLIPIIIKMIKRRKLRLDYIYLCISLIFCFIVWLEAPDIRFALGLFVSIPMLLVCYLFPIERRIFKFLKLSLPILFFCLIIKNINNFQQINFNSIFPIDYNYETFETLGYSNGFKVVRNSANHGFCYDIKNICLISKNEINFSIKKNKFGYLQFFEN
jgi:hypothetical protein